MNKHLYMFLFWVPLIAWFLTINQTTGFGDTVILHSGERLDGALVQEKNGIYKMKVDGIWRMIDPRHISEIRRVSNADHQPTRSNANVERIRTPEKEIRANRFTQAITYETNVSPPVVAYKRDLESNKSRAPERDEVVDYDETNPPFFLPDFKDPQYLQMKIKREDADYYERLKVTEYINAVNLADRELHKDMIDLMKDFEMAKDLSDKDMAKGVVEKRIDAIKKFIGRLREMDEPQATGRFKRLLVEFYDAMIVVEFAILEKFFGGPSKKRLPMNQYLFEMYRNGVRSFLELSRLIEDYDIVEIPDMLTRQKKMFQHYLRYNEDILNDNLNIREETLALQIEIKKLHLQTKRLQEFTKQLHYETMNYLDEIIQYQKKRVKQKGELKQYMNEL